MERMRQSTAPMWMDICGNIDGDTAPFPGHSAKVPNTSNWQFRASNEPRWNGARFPHCTTTSSQSETPSHSQTQIVACGVNKQTSVPRPQQETTQHILEQMLQELDRAPLITFSSFNGPPHNMSSQHNTTAAPINAHFLHNNRTSYDQNLPARQSHGGQDRFYNSSAMFQYPPMATSSACRYELGGHHQVIANRHEPRVSTVHHTSLMSHGVNKPTYDLVAPAPKVPSMTDAPTQMTRSLLELARLVDNPPVYERNVLRPIFQSDSVSNTQENKMLRKDYSVKTTAPVKMTQGLLPSCPKPKPSGLSVNPPPCVKPKDTASSVVMNQDMHKDSRHKLTTRHGIVYVDQQVLGMMKVNQSGSLMRSPVIVLERLQEDMVKSKLYQHTSKRRCTKPTQLLSYNGDSDSDADDDSSASDYVPSDCDRISPNEELDSSDDSTSMLDPHELKAELESDYSETSSDTADFSTCDDDNDDSNDNDDNMSCQDETKES